MKAEEKEKLTHRFIHELWPVNKQGSHEHALNELIRACSKDLTFDGNEVTFDLILAKYKEYIKHIRAINSERDTQYQTTKIDNIGVFIMNKRYNEEFVIQTNQTLDQYLYGD